MEQTPHDLPIVRYRTQPLPSASPEGAHSKGHIDCPVCQAMLEKMISPTELGRLRFRDAAPVWLQSRIGQVGPRTLSDYGYWVTYLGRFFDDLPLDQIHSGHIESYQKERSLAAGAVCVNHECGVLCQMLKRAGLWQAIEPHYRPLKVIVNRRGRALEPEEEEKLLRLASTRPRWKIAYCCTVITMNTTCGAKELRHVRLRDLRLNAPIPHFLVDEGAKNPYRHREQPLSDAALWAITELLKLAKEKGAVEPGHYLLPHRAHKGYKDGKEPDPTKPAGGWRRAWENLRDAAGLSDFWMNHLRHHAITRLLEDENVSERTVIEIAGHVSKEMLNRYSHIRMRTKKEAVDALSRKPIQKVGGTLLVLVKK